MPRFDEDIADDCQCPMCKANLPKSVMVPAKLPDGQKVMLKMSGMAYEKLLQLIEQLIEQRG